MRLFVQHTRRTVIVVLESDDKMADLMEKCGSKLRTSSFYLCVDVDGYPLVSDLAVLRDGDRLCAKTPMRVEDVVVPDFDRSYARWNDKYLHELARYDADDFLGVDPGNEGVHQNPMEIMVHNKSILYAASADGNNVARVVNTKNVFSNLPEDPEVQELKSGVVVPYAALRDKETLVTGVGTHYVVVCCELTTVLAVHKMDESDIKHFMREVAGGCTA